MNLTVIIYMHTMFKNAVKFVKSSTEKLQSHSHLSKFKGAIPAAFFLYGFYITPVINILLSKTQQL